VVGPWVCVLFFILYTGYVGAEGFLFRGKGVGIACEFNDFTSFVVDCEDNVLHAGNHAGNLPDSCMQHFDVCLD
jgi:hypothetical protein